MITDFTAIELTPGNFGRDCLGNGEHKGIECCCDECNYFLCCFEGMDEYTCAACGDKDCPRRAFKQQGRRYVRTTASVFRCNK